MGCDIHSKIEVKQNGQWQVNTEKVYADWREENTELVETPPDMRNYDWFGLIANVRNGRGFAGVRTGEGFDTIVDPRGVPDDATEDWKNEVEQWDSDFHSHSWLKLSDIDSYDWSKETQKQGVIPIELYKELRGTNNTPKSWCGGVSGANVVTLSMEQANELLGTGQLDTEVHEWMEAPKQVTIDSENMSQYKIYVIYQWHIKYSEWFSNCLKEYIDPMRKLAEKYEDVRWCFAFDN